MQDDKVIRLRERLQAKNAVIAGLRARLEDKNRVMARLNSGVKELEASLASLPERLSAEQISTAYHRLYYGTEGYLNNTFLGHLVLQFPPDMMIYQQLIYRTRSRAIVQTGVNQGGSILYFATLLDQLNMGPECLVVGVDLVLLPEAKRLSHPRIRLIEGDSLAPETLRQVESFLPPEGALVSLDSDHSEAHVRKEMREYQRYVPVGSYMVVEDTNINNHPVLPSFGPGPYEAVEDFFKEDSSFEKDESVWKHNFFSFHTWLRRVK